MMTEENEQAVEVELTEELQKKIDGKVSNLPDAERKVIELLWAEKRHDISDSRNTKKVAAILGMSVQDVKRRRQRALWLLNPTEKKPE
jgi:DNA-directed RNA polymerase specialized sigma subunit